jgi:hypothetical protein
MALIGDALATAVHNPVGGWLFAFPVAGLPASMGVLLIGAYEGRSYLAPGKPSMASRIGTGVGAALMLGLATFINATAMRSLVNPQLLGADTMQHLLVAFAVLLSASIALLGGLGQSLLSSGRRSAP